MGTNKGLESIVDKRYVNPQRDWTKIKKSLYDYNLEIFDECISNSLFETNGNLIRKICKILDIKTEIVSDKDTELKGTARLVEICKSMNATSYISGTSGKSYMDLDMFHSNNIDLVFQNDKDMIKKPVLEILKDKIKNV